MCTFAVFIAFEPHGSGLGNADHETPFGQVVEGLEVLTKLQESSEQSGYGDLTHLQDGLVRNGNSAAADFPKIDRIKSCKVVEADIDHDEV